MTEKETLLNSINVARNSYITADYFHLLNRYKKICERANDWDEATNIFFYRGEACFRLGEYEAALDSLNLYITTVKMDLEDTLDEECYDLLGSLYRIMGYDVFSAENYLKSIHLAEKKNSWATKIKAQLHLSQLYLDHNDWDKANSYIQLCIFEIVNAPESQKEELEIIIFSYLGLLYYHTQRISELKDILDFLNTKKSSILKPYDAIILEYFHILAFSVIGDFERVIENIELVVEQIEQNQDFLFHCSYVFEICDFIIQHNFKEYSRKFIDILAEHIIHINLPSLNVSLQWLEIAYQKKYSTEEQYLIACRDYVTIQERYKAIIKKSALKGIQNIELLKQTEAESALYKERSRRDPMTGLMNKLSMEYFINRSIAAQQQTGVYTAALLMIDLDNFKSINDTYGHTHGDTVLIETANQLLSIFDHSCIKGRIGGDEFLIFWEDYESKECLKTQATMLQQLRAQKPSIDNDSNSIVTLSIGITFLDGTITSYAQFLDKVDTALYESKEKGKNQVVIID